MGGGWGRRTTNVQRPQHLWREPHTPPQTATTSPQLPTIAWIAPTINHALYLNSGIYVGANCNYCSEFRLVLNLSEQGNYNPALVWIYKIWKIFLSVTVCVCVVANWYGTEALLNWTISKKINIFNFTNPGLPALNKNTCHFNICPH